MDLLEESERGWMMLFLVSNPKLTERKIEKNVKNTKYS